MAKVLLTAPAVAKMRAGKERREIADGGCPGLHLLIQSSGVKSWAVRYRRPNGHPAKLTLGSVDVTGKEAKGEPVIGGHLTLAAARALAAEARRQIALGLDPGAAHIAEKKRVRAAIAKSAENGGITFDACARAFIEGHKVKRSGQRPRHWREIARILGLSYPTDDGEPTKIEGGLADRWSARNVAEITGADVQAIVDEAAREGIPGLKARNDGVSDARGRKMADAMGAMFDWLMRNRRQMMKANPCRDLYRPGPPPARDRVLTSDEIRRFWLATDAVGQPFNAVLKLLLLTGQRLNEVAGIRHDELSEDGATWIIPGSRTKNHRSHIVPLSESARAIIAGAPRIEGCDFLFSTTGNSPISGWSKTKRRLDQLMGNPSDWVLHDLRRSAVTHMAELGIRPDIIEAVVNHISGGRAGVAGTYNRSELLPERRAALERWAAHVEGIVSGRSATIVQMRGRS